MVEKVIIGRNSGYALYLVLTVLSIISILILIILNNLRTISQQTAIELNKQQARLLAESGIARTEYFLHGGDGRNMLWETDSFCETIRDAGEVHISCRRMGGYIKLICTGNRISSWCRINAVMGRNIPDPLKPIITLTSSSGRGFVMEDSTKLDGCVVLAGDGFVSYSSSRGKRIPGSGAWVKNHESGPLPFSYGCIDTVFLNIRKEYAHLKKMQEAHSGNRTLSDSADAAAGTEPYIVQGNCAVEKIHLENRTIVAGGTITIGEGVNALLCTFMAKKIYINSGETVQCLFYSPGPQRLSGGLHESQFVSEDTIRIDKKAQCTGTCVWISKKSLESDTINHGGVDFNGPGPYSGSVICFSDSAVRNDPVFKCRSISIADSCMFSGYLVTDGELELGAASINGHIWAQKIIGVQGQRKETNWLFARSITTHGYQIPFPLFGAAPLLLRKCFYKKDFSIKPQFRTQKH